MAAWNTNKHHGAAIITLLAFLAPMVCHGDGGAFISFPICSGGWVRPITIPVPLLGDITICPSGSSQNPAPPPSSNEPVVAPPSGAGLDDNYYSSSCPSAEAIVKSVVEREIAYQGKGIGAGLIRLHFHDCFVKGCDASVLLNTTKKGNPDTEREGAANKDSLRGFDVIDKIKDELDAKAACRDIVSCADILAYAARDAARSLSGGKIEYAVQGGRWDALESSAGDTDALPGPLADLATLKAMFAAQQLDQYDLVALSGAHSIGQARCKFRSTRPGAMETTFALGLNQQCLSNGEKTVKQDYKTPDDLDRQYYQNILDKKVLFDSDAALTSSTETNARVDAYRTQIGVWEKAFGESMKKMGKIKIKTKANSDVAQIRKRCWTYNTY